MTSSSTRWRAVALATLLLVIGSVAGLSPQAAVAATWPPIGGMGSTWSSNALDQWRKNVASNYGMTINYNALGSTAGRTAFIAGSVDFAVSEIPFQLKPQDGTAPEKPVAGSYAYMPIVAGGTSFMYNLKIGGKKVTTLQLKGETITKIFTGVITKWNDPAIVADNPTLAMPDKTITPVVRSDGSGSTAQFTLWMSKQHSALWNTFCAANSLPTPCGLTSQYPTRNFPGAKAQAQSLGVAGYVSQSYGEGAITYVEYSYALKSGFPVAKVQNASGAFVEPTASNVAVALTKARINMNTSSADYLTQILDDVYTFTDARSYPLSSYSYMIVPTTVQGIFTAAKGKTLAAFTRYMLCDGQLQAGQLGYSPLPANLVAAGFEQIKRIPGGEGASACAAGIGAATPGGAGGSGSGDGSSSGDGSLTGDGELVNAGGEYGDGSTVSGAQAASSPFTLPKDEFGASQSLMIGAGVLLVLLVVLPPLFSRRLRRWGPASRD
jgi:phosphate transport system substrate-binding protein